MLRTMLFSALIASASHAMSATLIEVKTDEGMTKIYTDGSRSRMESGKDGYMMQDAQKMMQQSGQISPEAMQQLRQMQQR